MMNFKIVKQLVPMPIFLALSIFATAQSPVNYPQLGLSFTMPDGWQAREMDGYLLAGSTTEKGIIVITQHQVNSVQDLVNEANAGINDGQGTTLQVAGQINQQTNDRVGATFEGNLGGYPSKSYVLSMISPYGGGLTIMAAVEPQSYTDRYRQLAESIGSSVKFAKPDNTAAVSEWQNLINGCKLSYYNSYNSGGGSGYSTVITMSLCQEGYFVYDLDDQMVLNGQGNLTGAYSFQNSKGNGEWKVVSQGANPVLQLRFYDGRVKEYALSRNQEGHTLLNGERYLRTCNPNDSYAEARPDCW